MSKDMHMRKVMIFTVFMMVLSIPMLAFAAETTYTYDDVNQSVVVRSKGGMPTITASAGSGGTISPTGATKVAYGSSKAYTITPNKNCVIQELTVDKVVKSPASSYTFSNITDNHTIVVQFSCS
jgi:hypothetical protein